jgi:arsenate reductase
MSSPSGKERVLILCTGNSCRSQLAEALWRDEAGGRYEVASAGTAPKPIHPLTARVLQELSISLEGHRSKHVNEFIGLRFDLVVTVCDQARETCPTFPGAAKTLHWPFDDPAAAVGKQDDVLAVFRRVRDEIRRTVRDYIRSS